MAWTLVSTATGAFSVSTESPLAGWFISGWFSAPGWFVGQGVWAGVTATSPTWTEV